MTSKNTLSVNVNSGDILPYSKKAPVQALYATLTPILGQLVYTDQNYDLKPGILESFKWDHKKGVYVLKLKKGLSFHNGRDANAKDLEFSILRGFFTPKRSFFAGFFGNIEGIEKAKGAKKFKSGLVSGVRVVDNNTVEVKLKRPNPSFLHSLNRSFFSLVPIEEFKLGDYEVWKNAPVGTGPYKVFSTNEKLLVLEKVSTSSAGPNFLRISSSGRDDLKINQLENDSDYEMFVSSKATSVTNIVFNYQSDLGKDLNFRKALEHAINRDQLAEGSQVFGKTDQFLASHFWGRIDIKPHHDPDKAKKFLSSVSIDLSKVYKIPVFNSSFGDKVLGSYISKLERQLIQVGLKVKFVDSKEKYFPKSDKETPFRIITLGADVADPLVNFGLMRGKQSPLWPHFPEKDDKMDKLIGVAKKAESLDKKALAVQALSRHFFENVITVPLFERRLFTAIKKDRISDVGKQNGGLTFYLDRVRLKGGVQ